MSPAPPSGSEVIAAITVASATLLSVMVVLLIAILGGVANISMRLGRILGVQDDHATRITRLEVHEDAHDAWHLARGDR